MKMKRFGDIRIAPKLIVSFVLVSFLAGIVGATGYSALDTTHYWLGRITGDSVPSLVQILRMREDIDSALGYSRAAVLSADPSQQARFLSEANAAENDISAQFAGYFAGITHPLWPEAIRARQIRGLLHSWIPSERTVAQLIARHTRAATAEAARLSVGPLATAGEGIKNLLSVNAQNLTDEVASRTASAEATQSAAIAQLLTVVVGAILLAIVLGLLIARSIAGPLGRLTRTAALIASGDTTATIDLKRGDELGILAQSLRSMVSNLQERTRAASAAEARAHESEARTRESADRLARGVTQLIDEIAPAAEGDLTVRPHLSADAGDVAVVADFTGVLIGSFADVAALVREASTQVQTTSGQLTARVQQLANEVQERTVQVNETAAVAEHIADSATDVLSSVEQVNRSTQEAVESVEQGNAAVARTLERMDAMRATMIQATRQIKRLSDSSLAMNGTVGLVLQFAGDLELLADNAQIEAARHSEAGGVFTAVAEQTGRLAEDARKALTDIQSAVLNNRQETAEVGRQMEQVATEVIAGARAVEEARAAFNNITRTVRELRGFVERVNSVAQAQVRVAGAVNSAMQQITTFFGETADGVRLSEEDATQLNRTINGLRGSIAHLKLESDETFSQRAA